MAFDTELALLISSSQELNERPSWRGSRFLTNQGGEENRSEGGRQEDRLGTETPERAMKKAEGFVFPQNDLKPNEADETVHGG